MRRVFWILGIAAVLLGTSLARGALQIDTIRTQVDLVVVPVTVKDGDAILYDLRREDFTVFEDGRQQEIREFSTDATPLSVAVLIDTGMGGTAIRRFMESIVSLTSAFVEVDEIETYRFDRFVSKLADFSSDPAVIEKSFEIVQRIGDREGDQSDGPALILPGRGPGWLRAILDSGAERRVLNDAIYAAATDLQDRPREKRKVILVVSDGQVAGETEHTLEQARTLLVRNDIQVYGIAVGFSLLEGSTSILHSYSGPTGGDVFGGRSKADMDEAFARIAEQARHQHVISYVSNNEVRGRLPVERTIDVRINRPGLKVIHRKTYLQYPVPR